MNKSIGKLKTKADAIFSKYIRLRDADKFGYCKCITCGARKFWKELDCGHFMSRKDLNTRYHEQNANAQCKQCNGPYGGKQFEHGIAIEEKFGEGTAERMLQESKKVCKFTWVDYEMIIDKFTIKFNEILKQKPAADRKINI